MEPNTQSTMRNLILSLFIVSAIPAFAQVQIVLDVTPPTCDGCCDGTVNMTIDGCMAGSLTYSWTGPAVLSGNDQLTEVCETGVYTVAVTDDNGTTIQAEIEMVYGADPFTITSNEPIDCLGGNVIYCTLFYFPPSDSLSNGEACINPPPCWTGDVEYVWTYQGVLFSTSDCVTGLPPGEYGVEVINDDGEIVSLTVLLEADGAIGVISEAVCAPNSIAENQALPITLAPNPCTDFVQLTTEIADQAMQYSIYDGLGRVIQHGRFRSLTERIDVSTLGRGSYLIRVLSQQGKSISVIPLMIVR